MHLIPILDAAGRDSIQESVLVLYGLYSMRVLNGRYYSLVLVLNDGVTDEEVSLPTRLHNYVDDTIRSGHDTLLGSTIRQVKWGFRKMRVTRCRFDAWAYTMRYVRYPLSFYMMHVASSTLIGVGNSDGDEQITMAMVIPYSSFSSLPVHSRKAWYASFRNQSASSSPHSPISIPAFPPFSQPAPAPTTNGKHKRLDYIHWLVLWRDNLQLNLLPIAGTLNYPALVPINEWIFLGFLWTKLLLSVLEHNGAFILWFILGWFGTDHDII